MNLKTLALIVVLAPLGGCAGFAQGFANGVAGNGPVPPVQVYIPPPQPLYTPAPANKMTTCQVSPDYGMGQQVRCY